LIVNTKQFFNFNFQAKIVIVVMMID